MGAEGVSVYRLFTLVVVWLVGSIFTTQHREGIGLHPAGLGKNPDSKSKVRFLRNGYYFGTIVKLRMRKPNHCNGGQPAQCKSDS